MKKIFSLKGYSIKIIDENNRLIERIFFLALITLLFFDTSQSQKIVLGGTRIISRDAGFEITFPGGMLLPRRDIQKDKPTTFVTADSSGTYLVAYNTIKTVPLRERTVKTILQETLSNYLRNDTKIISSNDVSLGFFRGKSVKFKETNDTATFYNRFDCYVYGDIVLQVAFIGTTEMEIDKEDITKFFNSLSLIDRQFEKKALKFSSEEKEYSIFLPQGYDIQYKKSNNPDSIVKKNPSPFQFPVKVLKGAVILSSQTYTDELFKNKNSYQVLEEAMRGALDLQKIDLLSGQFLLRDEYPGISFTGITKSGVSKMYIRYEYYLKEHKLFQVGYSCYSMDELDSDEVLAYFRSFEIKK